MEPTKHLQQTSLFLQSTHPLTSLPPSQQTHKDVPFDIHTTGTLSSGNPVYRSFSNGTYNISLTVTDSSGNTTTSSRTLTVSSPPQPILTTISAINSGTYSTRDWVTQKHMYSSSGVPSAGTLVEIKNAVLSNVANGAASGDCND